MTRKLGPRMPPWATKALEGFAERKELLDIVSLLVADGASVEEAPLVSVHIWASMGSLLDSVKSKKEFLKSLHAHLPSRKQYKCARTAHDKARIALKQMPAESLFYKHYLEEALRRLDENLAALQSLEQLDAHDRSQRKGGAIDSGAFASFAEIAVMWFDATGKWPPQTTENPVHAALMALLSARKPKGRLRGVETDNFRRAVAAAKRWRAEQVASGVFKPNRVDLIGMTRAQLRRKKT